MNQIEIRYRPIRFLPWTRTLKATHPETWGDLTPAQIVAVACVFKGTLTDDRLIGIMLNIPVRIVHRLPAYHKLKLIQLIEFIKDPLPYQEFIIKNLGRYRAPKPRLKDESFGAFIFAETYFSRYQEKADTRDLDRFIACWYRIRPFDEKHIEEQAGKMARMDLAKREAIAINYQLIREHLAKTYPHVFRRENETARKSERHTWVDVFDALVADDMKDQDKYASLTVSSVLRYLDKRIKKSLEDESKIR